MMSSYRDPRIEELAGALCEGQLSEAQAAELRQLLAAHPGARRLFAERMQLAYDLRSAGMFDGLAAPALRKRKTLREKAWHWGVAGAAGLAAAVSVAVLLWWPPTSADEPTLANSISQLENAISARPAAEQEKVFKGFAPASSLSELLSRGVGVVVYFIKDSPNGKCKTLTERFSELEADYRETNYVILGVSAADDETLRKFKEEKCATKPNQLLLSDPQRKLGYAMGHKANQFDTVIIKNSVIYKAAMMPSGNLEWVQYDSGKVVVHRNIDHEREPRMLLNRLKECSTRY